MFSSKIFDELAELVVRAAKGKAGAITRRDLTDDTLVFVGKFGTLCHPAVGSRVPRVIDPKTQFFSSLDVRNDPRLTGYPLQKAQPPVDTLLWANISPIDRETDRYVYTAAVYNAPPEAFESSVLASDYMHAVTICRQFMVAMAGADQNAPGAMREAGFAENSAAFDGKAETRDGVKIDATVQFLFETLRQEKMLHQREDGSSSYVTLRTWQKKIKQHQLQAFEEAKRNMSPALAEGIAAEMAEAARGLYGNKIISAVVPVPASSSNSEADLSDLVAVKLASKLDISYKHILAAEPKLVNGKRVSKGVQKISQFALSEAVTGCVLLVNAVTQSEKILTLAQDAVQRAGTDCFAMSWIGG